MPPNVRVYMKRLTVEIRVYDLGNRKLVIGNYKTCLWQGTAHQAGNPVSLVHAGSHWSQSETHVKIDGEICFKTVG